MDFQLGTVDKDKYGVLAIEITKYITDQAGNPITPIENIQNVFTIYRKGGSGSADRADQDDVDSVKNMDVNAYANGTPGYTGYTAIHTKTTTVSIGGIGSTYDYDVDAGMVFIEEDQSDRNLPKTIVDVNGKVWNYKGTRIETEYVWRDDGIEYSRHVSRTWDNYRSNELIIAKHNNGPGFSSEGPGLVCRRFFAGVQNDSDATGCFFFAICRVVPYNGLRENKRIWVH
ncbi:MAG: hypothetical protein K6E17_05615 [Clostridiales bacterium]|nr:hypothetical protein [Clostridiales bacterium]